LCLKSINS